MATPTITAQDVRFIRDRLKLTQAQLADRVGVQHTSVSLWESQERNPSGPASIMLDQLLRMARRRR